MLKRKENTLFKRSLPRPLFVSFRSFQTQFFQKKTLGVSGMRTQIVRVEGEDVDHLTTTITAQGRHFLCN